MLKLLIVACYMGLLMSARMVCAEEKSGDVVAGTYDILICRGPCAFDAKSHVVAKGSLILFAEPLGKADLDRFDENRFSHHFGEPTNGCFTLERVGEILVLVEDVGVTSWSWNDGRYQFSLYHSPDAGYAVTVERTVSGLSGSGQFWGAGVAAPTHPTRENVIARRTGNADISHCTFQTAEEHEFRRLLADPARERIFAIEQSYRKALIAELEASPAPRDWAMAGWIQYGETSETDILRARAAAPDDRFIQWMSLTRTHIYSRPAWINGAPAESIETKELDDSALADLQHAEPENAYPWLASLRIAVSRHDAKAIDAALAHIAAGKIVDDHAAEFLTAQLALFRTHPLPPDFFVAVGALDSGWGIHGAFTADIAPYYENEYPFANIGMKNLFPMREELSGGLFGACVQATSLSAERKERCVAAARVMSRSRSVAQRADGFVALSALGDIDGDDLARVRMQAWLEQQYWSLHPRLGTNDRPYVEEDVAFVDDWLHSLNEFEALRSAVVRAGKPAQPPDDFKLNTALYQNFQSTWEKSRVRRAH